MKKVRRVAVSVVVVAGLAFAWASVDRCGEWPASPGGLVGIARGSGLLQVGAAKAQFALPYPVTVGGYGPWRGEAREAVAPLFARATVIDVGGQRFGLVSLETVLVSDSVVTGIRDGRTFQVWVVATHTHTGPGNYDARLAAEIAALGPWRGEVEKAIVTAANQAIEAATAARAPAVMDVAYDTHDLTRGRTGGVVDQALTRIRFRTASGGAIAQWLLFGGHPTLVPRGTQLDGDFPNRVSQRFEAGGGVTMVLQTAGADAVPNGTLEQFSGVLGDRFARMADGASETEVAFGLATTDFILSHPDGSRVGPAIVRPAIENALCAGAMMHAEIGVLRLGSISLAAIPAEVTYASAKVIEQQSKTTQVLSLANGYEGYLEPEEVVTRALGESHLQYFGPQMLSQFAEAAHQAGSAAGTFGATP